MQLYCGTCKTLAEAVFAQGRPDEPRCPVCDRYTTLTLRQRAYLMQHVDRGYSLTVRDSQFTRKGRSGVVCDETRIDGVSLDFMVDIGGGHEGPTIESWEWDEVYCTHLLIDAGPLDSMSRPGEGDFWKMRGGDAIMLSNGVIHTLYRRKKMGSGYRFELFGPSTRTAALPTKTFGAKDIHRLVDWLPASQFVNR